MSKNLSDYQHDRDLLRRVSELEQKLREKGTLQLQGDNAVNMQPTGAYQASSGSTPDGTASLFKFTLSSTTKKMIFAPFYYTIYQGSIAVGNEIGHANSLGYGYRWRHWTDWGDISLPTNGYNNIEYIWVENHTGSAQNIILVGEWRFVVNGGAINVS